MKKISFFYKDLILIFLLVFFSALYLAFDEPKESIFLMLSISILIIIIKDREKILSGNSFYFLAFIFILSYIVSISFIHSRGYSMNLLVTGIDKDIKGKAVLLIYEGEPEKYSFEKGITNIQKDGAISNKVLSPFILWNNKRYYQELGKSDYKKNTAKVKEELQALLPGEFKVYVSYLYDTTYVEEALIDIVNDGYKDVIIVPVILTDGHNLNLLKSRIEKMKLFKLNINVKYTEPLWNSEAIAISYESIISQHIDKKNISSVGLILVGEGQKGYKRNNYLKAVKEDSMFRNRIKSKLVSTFNINEYKIKTGWFSYIDPDYEDSLKSLLDYSVGKIFIIYTKPSVTNIENTIISKRIVSKVDIPDGVKVTIIDGFLDDLFFISELKNRIEFSNLQKWE